MIVAAVSPAAEHAGETRSTLEFAGRAKCIRNRAVVNRDTRGSAEALRRQLACLERCVGTLQAGASQGWTARLSVVLHGRKPCVPASWARQTRVGFGVG